MFQTTDTAMYHMENTFAKATSTNKKPSCR